jgi:hypothetical protein
VKSELEDWLELINGDGMAKYRRAAKIDNNQKEIVDHLREIPGVSVAVEHDDILVGRNGRNYWFEVKNPDCANKAGKVRDSAIKPSQWKLLDEWKGHYQIITKLDEILKAIGL